MMKKRIDPTTGAEMKDCAGWIRCALRWLILWALKDRYEPLD